MVVEYFRVLRSLQADDADEQAAAIAAARALLPHSPTMHTTVFQHIVNNDKDTELLTLLPHATTSSEAAQLVRVGVY